MSLQRTKDNDASAITVGKDLPYTGWWKSRPGN